MARKAQSADMLMADVIRELEQAERNEPTFAETLESMDRECAVLRSYAESGRRFAVYSASYVMID